MASKLSLSHSEQDDMASAFKLTINIVGAGKVGRTIARLIVKNNLGKIGGVCNRSLESAEQAIKFIGDGTSIAEIKLLPPADMTIIATPDDKIGETSIQICKFGNINPGNIFIHCSGVLTSEVMSAVKVKDGLVTSIHPMNSFADPNLAVENYSGTYCAMEGDVQALKVIGPLFKSFGSIVYPIAGDKKSLYHAAGIFASNYLVTLAQQAAKCLHDAGVEEKISLRIMIKLMKETLSNIETFMSLQKALTGPIKRGDISTIKNHLLAFSERKMRVLYSTLGKATIDLTTHDLKIKEQLEHTLSDGCFLRDNL